MFDFLLVKDTPMRGVETSVGFDPRNRPPRTTTPTSLGREKILGAVVVLYTVTNWNEMEHFASHVLRRAQGCTWRAFPGNLRAHELDHV